MPANLLPLDQGEKNCDQHQTPRVLLLICAIFLASRLLLLNYNQAEFTDGYAFIQWSFSFNPDGSFHVSGKHLPAYPLLIKTLSPFLDPIVSGRLISAFAGLCCLFLLYRLGLEIYGRRTALLASILFMVSAQFLFLTTRVLSEPLFLAFALASILQAFHLFSGRNSSSLPWLVLFSGLAMLTRPEGLCLAPLWIFGIARALRRRQFRPLLLTLAPLSLWLLDLWIINLGGSTYGSEMLRSFHSLSASRFARHCWNYVKIYPYVIFYPFFAFAVYNQFRRLAGERRLWLALVIYLHLTSLIILSVHWAWSTRFLAFPMILLLIEVAAGMDRFTSLKPGWVSRSLSAASIIGSVIFALVALHYQKDTFADIKETGKYIGLHFPDSNIFSNDPFKESFYSRRNVKWYDAGRRYRSGDIIALHSFYGNLEEQVQFLRSQYRIKNLFQAESVVVPLLANTIVIRGSNTRKVASQRFQPQKFTSVVLRIAAPRSIGTQKQRRKSQTQIRDSQFR